MVTVAFPTPRWLIPSTDAAHVDGIPRHVRVDLAPAVCCHQPFPVGLQLPNHDVTCPSYFTLEIIRQTAFPHTTLFLVEYIKSKTQDTTTLASSDMSWHFPWTLIGAA